MLKRCYYTTRPTLVVFFARIQWTERHRMENRKENLNLRKKKSQSPFVLINVEVIVVVLYIHCGCDCCCNETIEPRTSQKQGIKKAETKQQNGNNDYHSQTHTFARCHSTHVTIQSPSMRRSKRRKKQQTTLRWRRKKHETSERRRRRRQHIIMLRGREIV